MKIKLIVFLIVVLGFETRAQQVEIILSLSESCIDTGRQSIPIDITIINKSQKSCWIDLSAINYSVFEDTKVIEPYEKMIIGYFKPERHIKKNGFLFVDKSSKILVNNFSSIFNSYDFKTRSKYQLKGEYKNPRKRLFKKIYRQVINTGYLQFSICDY